MGSAMLIQNQAAADDDFQDKAAFSNLIAVNITYGNGTAANDLDTEIGGEASLAVRILYEHFINCESSRITFEEFAKGNVKSLRLDTAISLVVLNRDGRAQDTPTVFVLGIDEINLLHVINQEILCHIVHAIGSRSCQYQTGNVFFIPILCGTIQGPMEQLVREVFCIYHSLSSPMKT